MRSSKKAKLKLKNKNLEAENTNLHEVIKNLEIKQIEVLEEEKKELVAHNNKLMVYLIIFCNNWLY